ncbi:hypothetical protein AVEN_163394-1 [Araneus ventricosus]|uniref:Uncharacterized protein n=1 Tax=Araneus ventricosus TaxID=182803 RepID=A0A4Y2R040_ARAVE|nr:hypothetical protein AVEN_163394-1 [Araneus ventricosus]
MRACHSLKTSRRIQNKCSLIAVLGGKVLAILRGTKLFPMDDHQSKPTEPEHLGIEMDVLEDKNCSTIQVGPFPGSARRLSTNSEEGKEARHDIDITSGTYDLHINRSPGTSASGQCIAQKESTQLFRGDILDTQVGGDDSHDSEDTADEVYFLARHDLQFKRRAARDGKQLHSRRGESTQVFGRDVLDTQNSERLSEPDSRRRPTKPEPIQACVHSSKRKPNRGATQHHAIPGEPIGDHGEYWRRTFLNKDDVTPEKSSLEQEVLEAKRQWYRSRKMRPEYFQSPPSTNLEFWFITLAIIMIIITVVLITVLWKYLLGISP